MIECPINMRSMLQSEIIFGKRRNELLQAKSTASIGGFMPIIINVYEAGYTAGDRKNYE